MTTTVNTAPEGAVRTQATRLRRAWILAGAAGLAGLLLAVAWSAELVDTSIGQHVANGVLGHNAKTTAIAGASAGAVFAFVSGFAGTFTACNVAVFGALPDVAAEPGGRAGAWRRWAAPVASLGWLALGMLVVSGGYGFIVVLVGDDMPQLSTGVVGGHDMPVRLLQSVIAFGVIGVLFAYFGLASLGVLPDPLARRPRTRLIVLGALIGGFLVGRPYPLFHKLADYAVSTDNPFIGAATFALQSLGNVLLVAVLGVLLAVVVRGRLGRRLAARPERARAVAGVALVALGAFMVIYWDVRLPAHFGYGWFPTMPWNA